MASSNVPASSAEVSVSGTVAVTAVGVGVDGLSYEPVNPQQLRRAVRIAPLAIPGPTVPQAHIRIPGEFPKGKRRGIIVATGDGSGANSEEVVLTAEERMKQKRMLRNRESAARSRDKRRAKNVQLQEDITRRRDEMIQFDTLSSELEALINAARSCIQEETDGTGHQ